LTAKATDNLTATTTSAPVNVTVNAAVAQLHFIHTDHLNTPRVITNQASQEVWRWDHAEPFGTYPANENPSGLGTFVHNLRFPGQYFDRETNTHYNYFRDYDPGIGRYIQSDPIGLAGGINTYAYVENNPLVWSDPRGLNKRKLDPNSQECKDLATKIQNIRNNIARQQTNISLNPQNLPLLPPYPGAPSRMSVYGHQQVLDQEQRNLQRRVQEYAEKCGCDDDCPGGNNPSGNPAPGGLSTGAKIGIGLAGAACIAACIAFPEFCIPGLLIGGAAAQ